MSGRGGRGGRGGGGRWQQQQSPSSGGRSQQPARGGGPGRGRGRGMSAPPAPSLSSSAPPFQPPAAAPPASTLVPELEEKMTLQASTSASIPAPQPQDPAAAAVSPPPERHQMPPASTKAVRIPPRPGFGTVGRKVVVKANHFLASVADRDLHHYDVSISPEVSSKKVCRNVMTQLVNTFRTSHLGKKMLAYDGRKSCYAAGELPFLSKDFVVKLVDEDGARREREFKVSIKFASKVDLHRLQQFLQGRQVDVPRETLQCLDVALRQNPSNSYQVVGRSFFHTELGPIGELGNGLQYWKGFYQSLHPTQMGLSLNIDMSARAFYEPIMVSEYVSKYLNRDLSRPLSDQDRIKVKRVLRAVRVETSHLGHVKRHKISGVSTEPMQQLMFSLDETERKISVVQYFRQKYGIALKYPNLPAVQVGSDSKSVYLPMELCKIVQGQRYSKKLNEKQVTALLKATCQRPLDREKGITQMVGQNNYNGIELVHDQFGIQIRTELTSIEARVLPPPMLKYHETGKQALVEPSVGQWNMIDKKMVNGGTVNFWACITFSRSNLDVNRFCNELIGMCCSKGMEFNPRPLIPIRSANHAKIEEALTGIDAECSSKFASMKQTGKLQLLIVILPDYTGSYGKIKRILETELGIVSQCCQPKQALRYNKQYMENVALKINIKVGGRNTVLHQPMPFLHDRPTIVFGADVTHPQPGEDSSPSIAAVVASMDWPEVTKYRGLVSAQAHREEIIHDLYTETLDPQQGLQREGLIKDLLKSFYKSTGHKPHRIIFFRDGVSEGQFNQVLLYEMDAIRKACVSLQENYLPKVTFVVVQKRHHTRLFPARHGDRQTTDRSGNILPGTVVDTKICHPTEFDFYLCSHAGIQGTSRPAHYHVLFDENNFSADALQLLTNNMCYTYARATRSVSIVPPAYYAHLAAFRARYYIESGDISDSESGSARPGGATRDRAQEVRALPKVKENVKEVMFYC